MPKGVYLHKTPKTPRRKPTCLCSKCSLCKSRERCRRWRSRQKDTDDEFEKRLNAKFKAMGWD